MSANRTQQKLPFASLGRELSSPSQNDVEETSKTAKSPSTAKVAPSPPSKTGKRARGNDAGRADSDKRHQTSDPGSNNQCKQRAAPAKLLFAGFSEAMSTQLDGVKLPEGWVSYGKLLFKPSSAPGASKIAGFDFDGCLAKTSFYKKGPDAWSFLTDNVPVKLKEVHDKGYKLVIFTNQAGIGQAVGTKQKKILEITGRLSNFIAAVGLPMDVFCATAKSKDQDAFRKPDTGMWEALKSFNNGVDIDMEASFFVGDAAGRKRDHSDSDKRFAANIGIDFQTEDYFR